MSKGILVGIEGSGAEQALNELLALPGIEGYRLEAEPLEPDREPVTLATVGLIVAIAAGVSTVANNLVQLREKWRKAGETKHLSVVIEDLRGNRLRLDSATPDQIVAALGSIAGGEQA